MLEHRNSRLSSCWSNQIPLVRNLNSIVKVLSVTPPTPELDITTGPSLASGGFKISGGVEKYKVGGLNIKLDISFYSVTPHPAP